MINGLICRSREGAWIEIKATTVEAEQLAVAPARERGLKYAVARDDSMDKGSLPRGSVD